MVELRAQGVAAKDGGEQSCGGADEDPARLLPEQQLHDGFARGAECEPDADSFSRRETS